VNDSAEKVNPLFRQEMFFWCCAAVSLVALLGSHSLFWLEPRIAEAAREVLVTGKWYPFTVNFRNCSGLPLLEVWCVALSLHLGVSEFAARLPSALSALALLIGIRQLALRLFDRPTALLAGWLTLGSFGVLFMGRCCISGAFSAALAVWLVVAYLRSAELESFESHLVFCSLWALGILDRGLWFFALSVPLMAPWMYAYRARLNRNAFAAMAVAAFGMYIVWTLTFGEPFSAAWARLNRGVSSDDLPRLLGVVAANCRARYSGCTWDILGKIFQSVRSGGWPRTGLSWDVIGLLPMIIMPWTIIAFAEFSRALWNLRRLSRGEKCLLIVIVFCLLALVLPVSLQRPDFLPMVPFLSLGMGVGMLRGDGDRVGRWAVIATRRLLMVVAAFAVVSPITFKVWEQLLKLELPLLFWGAALFFGALVLFIMMLDSYPTRPLSRLTGLPDPLGSTVLGGTLMSICLLSFLLPAVRELRAEKQFLLGVRDDISGTITQPIINIDSSDFTALMLFYTGAKEKITRIDGRNGEDAVKAFADEFESRPGQRIAVVSVFRDRDMRILRRCAEAAKLKIDLDKPDRKEAIPPGCVFPYRQHACWLVSVPEYPAGKSEVQPITKKE